MTNQDRIEYIRELFRNDPDIYIIREEEYIHIYCKRQNFYAWELDLINKIPNIKKIGIITEMSYLIEDKDYDYKEEKTN